MATRARLRARVLPNRQTEAILLVDVETESDSDASASDSDSGSGSDSEAAPPPPPNAENSEDEEEMGRGGDEGDGVRVSANAEKKEADRDGADLEKPYLPNCPVCLEIWTSDGPHRVCCIPCGHVYGRSCLERWLQRCGNKTKCPQCNRKFKHKDIINLYAPEIVVPNDDLKKELLSLREKHESLKKEREQLLEEIRDHKRQILLQKERSLVDGESSKRQKMAVFQCQSCGTTDVGSITSLTTTSENTLMPHHGVGSTDPCTFVLQNELFLSGARVMGIDASSLIIVSSGRSPGIGGEHVLSKISMFAGQETEKIQLPPNTKAIRDICILPNRLAVFASLGRKLSLFSMASNNVVLQYDLPAPGWSCSGDKSSPHHIYAGLQNGMLWVFDIRQTAVPLRSMEGLSGHPVHTIHSIADGNESRKVLTASSIGPCMWDIDGSQNRPTSLIGMENQGVCISLACATTSSDLLVASFRPKVDVPDDTTSTQAFLSPSPALSNSGKLGYHALIRRTDDSSFYKDQVCHGSVSELRMSKSAIIPCGTNLQVFAYGDESLHGVRTWGLPSFQTIADLSPHRQPILDLRYAESSNGDRYLGCLSDEKLQVFKIR